MKFVLDSNILFSALISGKEVYLDIFKALQIFVPDFIFIEISKYENKIISKTKVTTELQLPYRHGH